MWPVLSLAFVVIPKPGYRLEISDESLELRVVTRDELRDVELTPVHREIRDAYLAFDGNPVLA